MGDGTVHWIETARMRTLCSGSMMKSVLDMFIIDFEVPLEFPGIASLIELQPEARGQGSSVMQSIHVFFLGLRAGQGTMESGFRETNRSYPTRY